MSTIDRDRSKTPTLPPLEPGQRLDRAEFHARYEAMPPSTPAELIGGIVHIVASPLRRRHSHGHVGAVTCLSLYSYRTPGTESFLEASVFLDEQGEPQPDAALRIVPECGGQSHDAGEYIGGAPELVLEVSDSSLSVDLGAKRMDYERTGVREYIVVAVGNGEVFWHARRGDRLEWVHPDPDGRYRSATFSGLWLDPKALLASDGAGLMAVLDRGLASAEHAAFVARLATTRAGRENADFEP